MQIHVGFTRSLALAFSTTVADPTSIVLKAESVIQSSLRLSIHRRKRIRMTKILRAFIVLVALALASVADAALPPSFLDELLEPTGKMVLLFSTQNNSHILNALCYNITDGDLRYGKDVQVVQETPEPTAEPTARPTSRTPTAMPTIGAEFLIYDVTLQLTDATSNVLDATSTAVLVDSVAEASGVDSSEVTLDSYTATSSSRISSKSVAKRIANNKEQSFVQALTRSLRFTFTSRYTIEAILTITAAIADYPQFNNNITALYNQLTSALLSAAGDNTLAALIRQNSLDANSDTFATIGDVVVTDISDPIAQYYPTSMPTSEPVPSGQKYDAGEIAGIIIAMMVFIAFCAAGLYTYCTRKKDRSATYVLMDVAEPAPTTPKWTPIVVTQSKNNGDSTEFTNIADENMVL